MGELAVRTHRLVQGVLVLDVLETDSGLRLRLGEKAFAAGESGPYTEIDLDDLFVVCTARPWSLAAPGARHIAVESTERRITVHCTVGPLEVRAELAFAQSVLVVEVTWRNLSEHLLTDLTVGLALPLPTPGADATSVTLPQVLYRGNPSADPDRTVPRLGVGPHRGLVVEDHRLPVPAAHAEWRAGSQARFVTLYSLAPGAGSLGAVSGDRTSLLALSGPVMFNGEPDVAYTHKTTTSPHPHGYRELTPGAALTTRHALHWGHPSSPGHGFRNLVHEGLRLYEPRGARPHSLDRIIELKTQALDRRWYETDDGVAGYLKFTAPDPGRPGPGHEPAFLYGWTGQCLKLAWCDTRLGLDRDEPWRVERGRRAADFYLSAGSADGLAPGLRASTYLLTDGRWTSFERDGRPFVSSRAYGEALGDLADLIVLRRDHGLDVPQHWRRALEEGLDAVSETDTLVPLGWSTDDGRPLPDAPGAAGLPCVLALLKAERVTGSDRRREKAVRLLERSQAAFADDYATPFAFATLDAHCEDKESGMAFFQCAYELWRQTRAPEHEQWAVPAADWLLTWVYQWNPPYPQGSSFAERGFSAVGWPGVSVQNHHVDVFFPAYELSRFGQDTGREDYVRLADLIVHAMGQGICTRPGDWGFDLPGEQAEGFFPTHWQQRGASNTWNPSWVTAQPLSAALRLRAPDNARPWGGSREPRTAPDARRAAR
ncbi:hypothetical protein GCM10023080_027330 [Streptomyces pseudoechinosporeus]